MKTMKMVGLILVCLLWFGGSDILAGGSRSAYPTLGVWVGMKFDDAKKILREKKVHYIEEDTFIDNYEKIEVSHPSFSEFIIYASRGLIQSISATAYNKGAAPQTVRNALIEKYGPPDYDFEKRERWDGNVLSLCWGDCAVEKDGNWIFSPTVYAKCIFNPGQKGRFVYDQKEFCFGVEIKDGVHQIEGYDFSIRIKKKSVDDADLDY